MNKDFFTTARMTGLFYLGLAITGMFSFLFARAKLYVTGDAMATAANLITQSSLSRFGLVMELALVGFQAVAALWFFKLFRKTDSFAAISLAAFGLINTAGLLIANAFWLSAANAASGVSAATLTTEQANSIMALFEMHESAWAVSALFFGLWLIPMGYLVLKAKMNKILAWVLMLGGVGYMLSTFVDLAAPNTPTSIIEGLTMLASVGEFWMIGYLLFKKVKVKV